ncbi:MAG: ROK family protein [Magnetococcus sp. WYHC-3]
MKKNLLVGVSLGIEEIVAVLTDENFNIIERETRPLNAKLGRDSIATKIAKTITSLPSFHLGNGVGVAVPAVFGDGGKKVIKSSIKELIGADLFQLLSKRIDLPLFILRRNICALLAEQAFGEAKSIKNAFWVEIGRDISCAFLINGKIYRGSSGATGQISETIVDITREKRNGVGEFGSLISGEGIEALTGKSVYQILKENPNSTLLSKQILRDLKESLLTGLLNIKLLLDPEVFILSGDIVENFRLFRSSFANLDVKIITSELGKESPALGAAIAAYNQIRKKA